MMTYTKQFNIPYYDVDKYGYIRATNILKYFGETSNEETEKFLEEDSASESLGWMLYRWKVEIKRYAKSKEDVKVKTWISKLDRFYAYREFAMIDALGQLVAKASTVWICVDMNKKKPIRIPENYSNQMKILGEPNFKEFSRFREKLELENYFDFKVRRSDIDSNEHVNNAKYLSWMLESIPDNIYNEYTLSEFEIIYKKEIKYGDVIYSAFQMNKLEDVIVEFTHIITDYEKNEEHSFGKTKWLKK